MNNGLCCDSSQRFHASAVLGEVSTSVSVFFTLCLNAQIGTSKISAELASRLPIPIFTQGRAKQVRTKTLSKSYHKFQLG